MSGYGKDARNFRKKNRKKLFLKGVQKIFIKVIMTREDVARTRKDGANMKSGGKHC